MSKRHFLACCLAFLSAFSIVCADDSATVSPAVSSPPTAGWSANFIAERLKEHCLVPKNVQIDATATNAFFKDEAGTVGSLLKFDKRYTYTASVLNDSYRLEVIATEGQDATTGKQLFHSVLEYNGNNDQSKVYEPASDLAMTTYGRVHKGRNGSERLFRIGHYFLGLEDTNGQTFLASTLNSRSKWHLSTKEDEDHPSISFPIVNELTTERVGTRVLRFSEKLGFRLVEDRREIITAGETEPVYERSVVFSYEGPDQNGRVRLKSVDDTTRSKSMNKRLKAPTVNVFSTSILEHAVGTVDPNDVLIVFPKGAVISDNINGGIFLATGDGGEIPREFESILGDEQ
ncbi:MAG: hypothetical protein ACF8AM_07135 [Rhodopirellula sp. JB055]|uniref:hypothetical protein n=1 Tax=Rhodopirellula sp. JB055 TaxID=3342846 RepID=UPI00370AC036